MKITLLTTTLVCLMAFNSNGQSSIYFEREYVDVSKKADFGRKGDLALYDSGFVSTGTEVGDDCSTESAFLLHTDTRGDEVWSVLIGNDSFNYHGYSVIKSDTHEGYIIVGSTDQGQIYKGVYGTQSCQLINAYQNAFIAFYDPTNSSRNWVKVFGDVNLHDVAYDVIEDSVGHFVVTGLTNGKEGAYGTCPENNSSYITGASDREGDLLLAKFDVNGNSLFIQTVGINNRFKQGVEIELSSTNADYLIFGEETNSSGYQSNPKESNVLVTNSTGVVQFNQSLQNNNGSLSMITTSGFQYDNNTIVSTGYFRNTSTGEYLHSFIVFYDRTNGNIVNYHEMATSTALGADSIPMLIRDIILDYNQQSLIITGEANNWYSGTPDYGVFLAKYDVQPGYGLLYNTGDISTLGNTIVSNVKPFEAMDSSHTDSLNYHIFGAYGGLAQNHEYRKEGTVMHTASGSGIGLSCSHAYDTDSVLGLVTQMQYGVSISSLNVITNWEFTTSNITKVNECDLQSFAPNTNGNDEVLGTSEINIRPNPTNGVVYLDSKRAGEVTIYDLSGKVVYNAIINAGESQIDLSTNAKGTYVISFQSNDLSSNAKLLLE